MDPNLITKIVETGGIIGVLGAIISTLLWYIDKRTVPKLAYDQQSSDLQQIRADMSKLIGPALDRLATLQEKQLTAQEEMWRRLESHSEALASLSQDVKLISHELSMRRIEQPRDYEYAEFGQESE